MRALISSLLCVVLTVHAALGCCWHPASDCTGCQKAAQHAGRLASCGCHDQGQSGIDRLGLAQQGQTPLAPEPSHEPSGCRGECRRVCVTLPAKKVQVDPGSGYEAPPTTTLDIGSAAADTSLQVELTGLRSVAAAPVPLHLLHQILLV